MTHHENALFSPPPHPIAFPNETHTGEKMVWFLDNVAAYAFRIREVRAAADQNRSMVLRPQGLLADV